MKGNQLVYIVEGADCTGKTTLCQKLADAFNIPYVHLTYYEDEEKMHEQFQSVIDRINNNESLVIDRFVLSNIIYGEVFQNGKTVKDFERMLDIFSRDGVNLVICLPDNDEKWLEIFEGMTKQREEMYCDVDSMRMVNTLFKHYAVILSKGCFIYNLIIKKYKTEI